ARRPDVPAELDAVIRRLMALLPGDRYPNPQAVMRALLPFLKPDMRDDQSATAGGAPGPLGGGGTPPPPPGDGPRVHRVLLVDDEPDIRSFCQFVLQAEGLACDQVGGGTAALAALKLHPYDLVVLDINMPDMLGTEVCRRLRQDPPGPHLKVIMA